MENNKPNVSVTELRNSYINLPVELFQRRLTANEFGAAVLLHLKTEGLGLGPVKMLGYAFFGALSPVEIAVYGYLCYAPNAPVAKIAYDRKLTERIVGRAVEELIEAGLVEEGEDGMRAVTTLESLNSTEPAVSDPVSPETENV